MRFFRTSINRDLLLLGLSLFTWGVGEGMFTIFQPIYLQQLGANPVEIGGILGAVGISMAFVQVPVGYLTDRAGPRRLMWTSWILGLLATGMMAFAPSLPFFVGGMLLYGTTSSVVVPMNTYITRARGSWSIERALSVNSALFNAGYIIGPILGGFLGNRIGLQAIYRVSAAIFVLSTIIILPIRSHPVETHGTTSEAHPGLLHNQRFLGFLALTFLVQFALYLPQPLTPNYLQTQRGLSLAAIGQLGAIGGLSNAAIQIMLGGLNARIGLLVGQVLLSLYAFLLWRGSSLPWYILAYGFLGGYRLVRVLVPAFARPLVSAAQTGIAFGLLETINALTIILAPPAAGLLFTQNPAMVYITTLALLGLSFFLTLGTLPWLQHKPFSKDLDQDPQPEEIDLPELFPPPRS